MTLWLPHGFVRDVETEVRRSRFLARVARVDDEDAARTVVAGARAEHSTARHHCLAFIVDSPDALPIERSSDDGEPAGTAGMPMLDVLRGSGLTNVVAVVTRYFGGVLLGAGGLVRAYSGAVAAALDGTPRVRPEVRALVGLEVSAADAGRVQGALLNRGIEVVDATWGAGVLLTLAVPDPAAALPAVREVVQADVDLTLLGEMTTEVPA